MTTSSSDRDRCTRISPSAILDDRLSGKELEWARDHLRRCEACRDRVEDFREMLLRVGRLPNASLSAAVIDEAYSRAIPEQWRRETGSTRPFEVAPATQPPATPPGSFRDLRQQPIMPEITSVSDMLTELEREIFRDEPAPGHPAPLAPVPEPPYPTMAEPSADEVQRVEWPADAANDPTPVDTAPAEPTAPEPAPSEPSAWPVDTRDDSESLAPQLPDVLAPPPLPEWGMPLREVRLDSYREPEPVVDETQDESEARSRHHEMSAPTAHGIVFSDEPAIVGEAPPPEEAPPPPRKPDNAMRIAVGLGAAACVLLAAILYEGGWFLKARPVSSTSPAATRTARVLPTARPSPSASASPTPAPAPVLFTLGNGVAGDTVFRIRPGTAIAGFTRLVFDMHGNGLPAMVVTQPDALHLAVTFRNTGAALAVNGIHSYQVAGVEPPVQQGADAVIMIDLARPVRVTAFTLPQTTGYAWRLILDLHTP